MPIPSVWHEDSRGWLAAWQHNSYFSPSCEKPKSRWEKRSRNKQETDGHVGHVSSWVMRLSLLYTIPCFMNLHDNKRKGQSMLFRVKANFLWLNLRDKAALFLPVWVIWLSFCLLSVVCQSRSGAAWCLAENWPFMKQNNNIFLRQFCSNLQDCLCDFVTSCHSPGTLISGDFVQF